MQRNSEVEAVSAMKGETKLQRAYKPAGNRPLQYDYRGEAQRPTGQDPGCGRHKMISRVAGISIGPG